MKALWLREGALSLVDVEAPRAEDGEAIVRVRAAGICSTDLELLRGYYPMDGILGHEFVGVVEAAPGAPEWVGRRVVGEINVVCGACGPCRAGRRNHCERRTVLGIRGRHGAFAELLRLPVANLHAVPDHVPDHAAVFVEPLAAALGVKEQVAISAADRVLVIGDGKLGQLVAQTLALTPCRLQVAGRHASKLALLAARGIATLDLTRDRLPEASGADVIVECTGNEFGLALALERVRPRGTIVLKSTYAGAPKINVSLVVVNEVHLVGSRCGPFAPALELLARGAVDVAALVQARYPLREAVAALEHAARRGVLKVLIEP